MSALDTWFPGIEATDRLRPRLFCFPAAGGNTAPFYRWRALLADRTQVVPVELPGHRNRPDEPLHASIDRLVDDLLPVIREVVEGRSAFLGTSMGALIAFETARRLAAWDVAPVRLVVASCASPRTPRPGRVHRLPDAELIQELLRMDATPAEVFASPDLAALLLPALRADFTMVETYAYRPGPRLAVPLTAVAARRDPHAPAAEVRGWQRETDGRFDFTEVDGGHFFFRDDITTALSILESTVDTLDGGGVRI